MKINICFSSDNNYVQHLGVAITSILYNASNSDEYTFYIMDGGISAGNKRKVEKLKHIKDFKIEYIKIDNNDFANCPMTNYVNYITLPTYYRFKIPSLFPNVEKILYLDCDIIVMNDIAQLYKTNVNNYYLAAIPEVFNHNHKKRLDFAKNEYYFNAGVLLLNNKKWQEDNIEQKLFEYAINPTHEIVYQDQDILNEVLKGKIKYIDLKWNLQHDAFFYDESYLYHQQERIKALNAPSLIHFTHKFKPWSINCFNPYRYEYKKYLRLSPWKSYIYKMRYDKYKQNILLFMKNIPQMIFSIKNRDIHKVITIFGIKFKIKSKNNIYKFYCEQLNNKIEILRNELHGKTCYLEEKIDINYWELNEILDKVKFNYEKSDEILDIANLTLDKTIWQEHPLYCINNGVNTIFRYLSGLQLTKNYQTERIVCFDFDDAPIDHYQRYKFVGNYINHNDEVLDIACGVGYGSNYLSKKSEICHWCRYIKTFNRFCK